MVKALVVIVGVFRRVPVFEFAGAALIVAGVYGLAGEWWALIAAGVLALVKSFDLALTQGQ